MSEYGIKIKNIKAATLYGYNLGIRNKYDYSNAMFSNSLFSNFIIKHGLNVYKKESTRDIICLQFDFGSRSYDEEIEHVKKLFENAESTDSRNKIKYLMERVEKCKDLYNKKSKDEIRELFYEEDVKIKYENLDKKTGEVTVDIITYRMLYRNASKAKMGQVMFINSKLYDVAYDWLTMGLGKRMPENNAKIVELSAYAPLVTSTIEKTIRIPIQDVLILKDQDSFFNTIADTVRAEEYYNEETKSNEKRCIVVRDKVDVKNTLWDGMAIAESDFLPTDINGMALLRNHFFKTCAIRGKISLFFREWCEKNGKDYETYRITDMFGVKHRIKNIKLITTDNAIKWKKFSDLMGDGSMYEAYKYWCERIKQDDCIFGIVKTDHPSKLGNVQQMSYQMINTLPCTPNDVAEIAATSIKYVEKLKKNNKEFEKFLRNNANEVNHYEMLADLYKTNLNIAKTSWFKSEKKKIINQYVAKLRKGKITVNADNLTVFGNPYALLLHSVGEDYRKDPSFKSEFGTIQCYTKRFKPNEYLAAFRNPHNSPNNICYLHNVYSVEMDRYFEFSNNIMAINCIQTDIQDRANGMDFDSDFMFVTNHPTIVNASKKCYKEYPTVVNQLRESGVTYQNSKKEYAKMDSKFAKSQRYIGESSNLAQLAMTYYWSDRIQNKEVTFRTKELYDNFVILAVLAQVVIDGCKREYEIDATTEIDRIKALPSMSIRKQVVIDGKLKTVRNDFPRFMMYTKEVGLTKNGKEIPYEEVKTKKDKIKSRINEDLICPMNYLQGLLDKIQGVRLKSTYEIDDCFLKIKEEANRRQISKIYELVKNYSAIISDIVKSENSDDSMTKIIDETNNVINKIQKMKISASTINRLIETALSITSSSRDNHQRKELSKYTRKILNVLYRSNKEKFLMNFKKYPTLTTYSSVSKKIPKNIRNYTVKNKKMRFFTIK